MKASFIRTSVFLLSFFTVALLHVTTALSQNYVDARNYASPNVVVDLTVLDNGYGNLPYTTIGQRIMPAPAMRGIRTPQGTISRSNTGNFIEASQAESIASSVTMPRLPNDIILEQDLNDVDKISTSVPPKVLEYPSSMPTKIASAKPQNIKSLNDDEKDSPVPPSLSYQKPSIISDISQKKSSKPQEDIKIALANAEKPDFQQNQSRIAPITSIIFNQNNGDLSGEATTKLSAIVENLKTDVSKRIQIKAFASGTPEVANKARRLSLTRALNARTYLLKNGVKPTQIDVRALGIGNAIDNPSLNGLSNDRIDIVFIE